MALHYPLQEQSTLDYIPVGRTALVHILVARVALEYTGLHANQTRVRNKSSDKFRAVNPTS
jgi:hypothetical protein